MSLQVDVHEPRMIRCPVCDLRFDPRFSQAMPFCCIRCQRIDLGRWLDEEYRLTVEREDGDQRNDHDPDDEIHRGSRL